MYLYIPLEFQHVDCQLPSTIICTLALEEEGKNKRESIIKLPSLVILHKPKPIPLIIAKPPIF